MLAVFTPIGEQKVRWDSDPQLMGGERTHIPSTRCVFGHGGTADSLVGISTRNQLGLDL